MRDTDTPSTDRLIERLNENRDWIGPALAVAGLLGLRRTIKLAVVGAAAIWVLDKIQGGGGTSGVKRALTRRSKHRSDDDKVHIASEESFPASDPPSYSGTTSVGGAKTNGHH